MRELLHSQLQSDALERLCAALHDALARGGRAGEADLVDAGVGGEPGAEVVVAAERLEDAGREDLLGELDDLEVAVGGEGT